jgi:hypothetical protein
VFRQEDGTLAWQRNLNHAHVFCWPLEDMPVLPMITKTQNNVFGTLLGLDDSMAIELLSKETGTVVARKPMGNEFSTILSLGFRIYQKDGNIRIKSWQSELTITIPIKRNPSEPSGPTIHDVGKTFGKWFDSLDQGKEKSPSSSRKDQQKK